MRRLKGLLSHMWWACRVLVAFAFEVEVTDVGMRPEEVERAILETWGIERTVFVGMVLTGRIRWMFLDYRAACRSVEALEEAGATVSFVPC